MALTKNVLAFDLGAESGRGLVGAFDGERLQLQILHRFPNGPVRVLDALHWDPLRLFGEMMLGMHKAAAEHGVIASVGVDTWGVDFALIGRGGTLLGNPRHYRDPHTETIMEAVFAQVPRAEIFRQTGIQFMRFNSLFQLLAMQRDGSPLLEMAETLLFMPDLFHFWFTGVKVNEYTNASTSQMLDPVTRTWARPLLARLGVPERILGTLVRPGTVLGPMRVQPLVGVPVLAPATHDTAAAVAGIPCQGNAWAFISSGTWSLMGAEIAQPLTHERAHAVNFTNEGGVGGTIRLLKNIMGLWLIQECRRAWERSGQEHTYEGLMRMAAEAPAFISLVNPDDDSFLLPADMPVALGDFCRRTQQPVPDGPGAVVRCALESLALKYRWVLERLEELTGNRLQTVHIVGGGSQNTLLCQLTADACQRPVVAGPVEATAIGNVLTQLLGLGLINTLEEGRMIVRRSFDVTTYEPSSPGPWEAPYQRFLGFLSAILLAFVFVLPAAGGDSKADLEIKNLAGRATAPGVDVEQLRQEISAFRQTYPGTPQAQIAAGLLRDLPSPLDKYDADSIPAVEKFPSWQPKELVAILGEHRGRQAGPVTSVAYSRNGKALISGSTNGYLRFWDPATMRLQHSIVQPGGVYALAFPKEGLLFASGGGDGNVRLWEAGGEPAKEKVIFKVSSPAVFALAFAPSGKTLAAGCGDNRVALWDLTEDQAPRETGSGEGHTGPVRAVAFAPDGKTIASGSADKSIRLWNVLKDNKLKEKIFFLEAHQGGVLALSFHPTDEKTLVSVGGDGAIRFWNLAGGKIVPQGIFKAGSLPIHSLAWSSSGKTLATGHGDGTGRTWAIGGLAKEKAILEGHSKAVTAVAFSPDGSTVVTASNDWTVRQWPAVSGPKPRDKTVTRGHFAQVFALDFAADGKTLASGGIDPTIHLWDLVAPEAKERTLIGKVETPPIQILTFAPDGKSLAAAGPIGGGFRTYDTVSRKFIYTFTGHTAGITGVAFAPDGVAIASSSKDKTVRLWNAKSGKETYVFRSHESPVHGVSFSPDGAYLLSTSGANLLDPSGKAVFKNGLPVYQDSTLRIHEVDSKKEMFRWKDERVLPRNALFAPDGRHFVLACADTSLRTWSWPNPLPNDPRRAVGPGAINLASWSLDGRYYAAVFGGGVALYDAASDKQLRYWPLKENYGSLAFAPDSRHLAISMATGAIYILRLEEAGKK